MKCKNCGGVLQYQNGIWQCKSCGASETLDSIFEKVDVYVCYEESDTAGRRTKDSIIAQEVYRKLEESKVSTFYERVSADGMIGNDLEACKFAAIQKAKILIVLGTSVENFATIESKYSEHFSGKSIIPFCVDVNPAEIPKTISKMQAISYSTIGWDKDLIKGVYNILGRELVVDINSLYEKRKTKKVIIGIIAAVIAIATSIAVWILIKPATQNEIYDKANALVEQSKYAEALELFLKIPDHADSTNMIKKVYSQFEGTYQKDGITLRLDIVDNIRADLEVSITSDGSGTRFSTSTTVEGNVIEGGYQDNLQQTGKITLKLENAGIQFLLNTEDTKKNIELFFELSEKTDQQVSQIGAETLVSWVKEQHTISQIRAMGYTLEEVEILDRAGANIIYRIKDTDIYLTMADFMLTSDYSADFGVFEGVVAVQAPASILAPSLVGKTDAPILSGDLLYWPYGMLRGEGYLSFGYLPSGNVIYQDTPIGLTSQNIVSPYIWNELVSEVAE